MGATGPGNLANSRHDSQIQAVRAAGGADATPCHEQTPTTVGAFAKAAAEVANSIRAIEAASGEDLDAAVSEELNRVRAVLLLRLRELAAAASTAALVEVSR